MRVICHYSFYKLIIPLVVILANSHNSVSPFNIDCQYPIIISAASQDGRQTAPNYFGASVAFLKPEYGNSWIIIGAPKANSTLSSYNDISQPGVIWQCSLGKTPEETCRPLGMDTRGNILNDEKILQRKNEGMLGGPNGLSISGKNLVACASRIESWTEGEKTSYMHGSCYMRPRSYLLQNTLPVPTPQSYELNPLTIPKKDNQTNYRENRNGQAGFAVHFSKSGNALVMAAPGLQGSMGGLIQYVSKDGGESFTTETFIHAQPQCPENRVGCFQYFGYSVTSGYYFDALTANYNGGGNVNNAPPVQYASGAPRANSLAGNVVILQFPDNPEGKPQILQEIQGSQIGAYFGASLLTLDLNGDGNDDLIVGAPRFTRYQQPKSKGNLRLSPRMAPEGLRPGFEQVEGYGDEGAAFIYLSKGVKLELSKTLRGRNRPWSQFGTAMTSLGDLNMDGYKDFAVSAPFEDGSGAVYIYHGNKDGNFEETQVIYAKDIDSGLRGFGFSLVGNEDIDNNGFNDIAIGSFNSSQTVVLRSKPIITVHGVLKSPLTKLEMNAKAFLITSCVSFTGDHSPPNANLTIRLNADSNVPYSPRVHISFADEDRQQGKPTTRYIEYTEQVDQGIEKCTDFNAIVENPLESFGASVAFTQEISIPKGASQVKPRWMKIDLKKGTHQPPTGENFTNFCKNCPLVNERKPSELTLPLAILCGDDDRCVVNLELTVSFKNPVSDTGFTLGSADTVIMDIQLTNHQETAVAPGVLVTWWGRLKLLSTPAGCSYKDEDKLVGNQIVLQCSFGKLLEVGQSAAVSLEFDMRSFVVSERLQVERELIWNVTAITVSEMIHPETKSMVLPLTAQADPHITGSSYLDYFNKDTLAPKMYFNQFFEVHLDGPTSIGDVVVVFRLPVNITTEEKAIVHVRTVSEPSELMLCQATKGHFSQSDLSIPDEVIDDPDWDAAGIGGFLPIDKDISRESNSTLVENDCLMLHCNSPFVACIEVTCKTTVYRPGITTIINFPMEMEAETIRRLMKAHKVSAIKVESQGKLILSPVVQDIQPKPHKPDETIAITLIKQEGYKVSKWIYILAVIIGIVVLACVIFCLYSCGCFEEDKRFKMDGDQVDAQEMKPLNENEDKDNAKNGTIPLSPFSDVIDPPDFVPREPTIPEENESENE